MIIKLLNLRRVIPMVIGAAAMFAACEKEDLPGGNGGNGKGKHDTVYMIGPQKNIDFDRVVASADSTNVRYVILRSDGIPWGYAASDTSIYNRIQNNMILQAKPENRYKFRGEGELLAVSQRSPEATQWLKNFGFTFYPDDYAR